LTYLLIRLLALFLLFWLSSAIDHSINFGKRRTIKSFNHSELGLMPISRMKGARKKKDWILTFVEEILGPLSIYMFPPSEAKNMKQITCSSMVYGLRE